MVKISALLGLVALLASTPLTLAHGAGESDSALVKRQEFVDTARRSVAECQSKLKARHLQAKRTAKRDAFLQKRHGKLQSRAVQTSDPFNDTIPTCILAPEEEVGPYYVSGELIRDDVREDQEGIDLLVDVQVFDVATCTVLPNVMVDFWSCNSTGVYSGVEAEDTLGLTFLRGLVESDEDGIVQLTTKFPGHYSGRATHLHVVAHINGTVLPNGTYTGGTVPHIGQVFFPQSVITEVEATSPYNTNTVDITLNSEDRVYAIGNATEGYSDEVVIEKLGDSLDDGLFAYISVGLDLTATYTPTEAGSSDSDGGAGTGGMPSGSGMPAPSGAF